MLPNDADGPPRHQPAGAAPPHGRHEPVVTPARGRHEDVVAPTRGRHENVGAGLVPARGRRGRSPGVDAPTVVELATSAATPLLLATLFAPATVLSHPEMAWFLAYSGALFWLGVISRADFSFAYPLLALSYVVAMIPARFILHEDVTLNRILGAVIVVVGAIVISWER